MLELQDITLAGRLAHVSAVLRPGEVTAICGPNGAGKSSLLSCMAGLLVDDAGRIELDGEPLAHLAAQQRARAIGYLPQTAEVAWDMTVETLVALGRLPHCAGAHEDAQAVDQALAAMELDLLRHRRISRISGGERARTLAARVLAGRPRWLLADEPLANLDLAHSAALMGLLRAQADQGTGVVLVLHDLASAMNHASRVLVLARGALVADGPPQQALSEAVIRSVWGVDASWLGEAGGKALSLR